MHNANTRTGHETRYSGPKGTQYYQKNKPSAFHATMCVIQSFIGENVCLVHHYDSSMAYRVALYRFHATAAMVILPSYKPGCYNSGPWWPLHVMGCVCGGGQLVCAMPHLSKQLLFFMVKDMCSTKFNYSVIPSTYYRQSWNFQFFPEVQNCPSLKKLRCNSCKLMCTFQVHLWFNILTWFGVQKPRSHSCSNFSRWIAVIPTFRVANCDAIGENSRTDYNRPF